MVENWGISSWEAWKLWENCLGIAEAGIAEVQICGLILVLLWGVTALVVPEVLSTLQEALNSPVAALRADGSSSKVSRSLKYLQDLKSARIQRTLQEEILKSR